MTESRSAISQAEFNRRHYQNNKQYHKDRTKQWRLENPHLYQEQINRAADKLTSRYRSDPEYRKEENRKNRERYHKTKVIRWEAILLQSTKARAKKLGLEHDLELSDIVIPKHCPLLGVELILSQGKPSANSASVDRIDSTKGYTKDNIQIISYKANAMKSNASREELQRFADWINAGVDSARRRSEL